MLLGNLGAEFPNVRRFSIDALTDVIQPDGGAPHKTQLMVATALLRCLQDEDHGVRAAAIRALRTLGMEVQDTAAARARVQLLLQTFTSPHAYVRRFGITTLTELLSSLAEARREFQPSVMAALQARLEDADQGVRSAAATALKIVS